MRKTVAVLVAIGLLFGMLLAPAEAKKKKKKKKKAKLVQVDQQLFLHSTGCPAGEDNVDFLSITDADNEIQCWYTAAGFRNDIGDAVGTTPVTSDREAATRYWDALDGVPLMLDTSKPITGTIWTSGGACILGGVPCSPAGFGIGEMIVEITFVGTSGGTEIVLGEFSATYQVVPGTIGEIEIEVELDPALNRTVMDTFEMRTWQHGESIGHGVVNTNGETSSFVSVPTLAPPS